MLEPGIQKKTIRKSASPDSYYVDTGDDLTFEALGGGSDTVYATIAGPNAGVYLYATVENLVLLGTPAFGVGNELANTLTGSASGNWLLGGSGDDLINGKAGGDVLFGEAGADRFVFEVGTGGDVIGDYQVGVDKIDLSDFGFSSFSEVQALFQQVGGDGAIQLGGGDLVVLLGVTMANLTANDFELGGSSIASVAAATDTTPVPWSLASLEPWDLFARSDAWHTGFHHQPEPFASLV